MPRSDKRRDLSGVLSPEELQELSPEDQALLEQGMEMLNRDVILEGMWRGLLMSLGLLVIFLFWALLRH